MKKQTERSFLAITVLQGVFYTIQGVLYTIQGVL